MLAKQESFPRRTRDGLQGLSVFYRQFNDINFYVEDEDQENFYHKILSNLFPGVRLQKIFPLGGKLNVIEKARRELGDKRSVFIVDKDFDDILHKIVKLPNLFYLKEYSIENYLLESNAVLKFVIEEKPRIKINDISKKLDFEHFINQTTVELIDLFTLFIVAQYRDIENCGLPPERFVNPSNKGSSDKAKVAFYKEELQSNFASKEEMNDQLKVYYRRAFHGKKPRHARKHISGKYIGFFLRNALCREFGIRSIREESFYFRLSKNCKFQSLKYLTNNINKYIRGT